ncbi:MAG: HAMP domain-containing sensor histidine kinase [Pseudomonadota bacterium]
MIGTIIPRLYLRHRFLQSDDPMEAITSWRRLVILGAAATGAVWGLGGLLFYDPTSTVSQVYWPFVLAGMSAGSIVAQIGCMPAFVGFVATAISPYALRLAAEGDLMNLLMACALVLYIFGISLLARSVNAYLMASIRLSAENESLAERLSERTQDLAKQNVKLEQMVAVRTEQLEHALEEVKKSEASRRRMLADVSHELRTPLTIIQGEADVALRGAEKTSAVYEEALAKAKEAAAQTSLLVNDLLFIASSESGHARLRIDDMDLKGLLTEISGSVAHPIPFSTDLDDAPMAGDVSRVRQAVLVLVQNAQHYGAGANLIRLEHGAGVYRIAIEDAGPGMSDAEKKDAFQRFFRGTAADRYPGGTGLGLPVARAIVEAHGGSISLEDRPGGGLISTITLPKQHQIEAAS